MDITTLTHEITTHIVPYLPALYTVAKLGAAEAGKGVVSELGKKAGGSLGDKTKAIWQKLWPKIEEKPAALEAVKDAAAAPDEADNQASVRKELKKILSEDEVFADEIGQLWEEAKSAGEMTVNQTGDRNVNVIGNIQGNIITGDGHKL